MSQIDEFESIFRRAEREPFAYTPPELNRVVVLTDQDKAFAASVETSLKTFLPALGEATVDVVTGDQFSTVTELVETLEKLSPSLVVTFRHVQEQELVPQHSLGVYLDVLTQTLRAPVLVLAGTAAEPQLPEAAAKSVLVLTDHIRGDARLISSAAAVAPPEATLHLAHVEDDLVFKRYLATIDRIPEINSDAAREHLEATLLGDAREYMEAAVIGLEEANVPHETELHVLRGHRLRKFKALMERTSADLCVFNTKDDDQLAMHGMAYAIAVETVDRALLLL